LSGQRQRVRHRAADVQRGRRQHHPLDGACAALPPLRFQGQDPRRRGRRLADDLRRSRAVLRPERRLDGLLVHRRRSSEPAAHAAYSLTSTRTTPPLPLGPEGERIARASERLGWHWWPSDSYINSERYRGRAACNNCGPNGLGCVVRAKGSTDVTYWPAAIAN